MVGELPLLLPEFIRAPVVLPMSVSEVLQTPEFQDRFWSRVDRRAPSECWPWQGSLTGGYGQVSVAGRLAYVHRVAYLLAGYTIGDDLVLDHTCRYRACVNPAHLEPVTNLENILRGEGPTARNARTMFCPKGHWYGGGNLRVRGDGRRACRACERSRRGRP